MADFFRDEVHPYVLERLSEHGIAIERWRHYEVHDGRLSGTYNPFLPVLCLVFA